MEWLLDQTGDQALARAALTAIVRHHSAGASGKHNVFQAHPAATEALAEVLTQAGMEGMDVAGIQLALPAGEALTKRLARPRREKELLPYLLLVRALRMADQRSQANQRVGESAK